MSNFSKENNETAQRAELHRKIWAIADDVRGAVDGGILNNIYWGFCFTDLFLKT